MSKTVELHLPDEIAHYEGELRYFFDSMVRKLHANRHKKFAEGLTFEHCQRGIEGEYEELLEAVQANEPQFAAYMETVDLANWAFLTGVFLGRLTRPEYDALKENEDGPE